MDMLLLRPGTVLPRVNSMLQVSISKNGNFLGIKKISPVYKKIVFLIVCRVLKWISNIFSFDWGPRNPRSEAKHERH